jgi:hypothetical protein
MSWIASLRSQWRAGTEHYPQNPIAVASEAA